MREIGIDIGGTFTDVVCLVDRRVMYAVKVPNSKDLLGAVMDGVRSVMALSGDSEVARLAYIHGTTVATNAVLEGRGAVTACLTTKGFEDVLEIGRQKRSSMYDLWMDPETPAFMSPRRLRAGITERVDGEGNVLQPLDEEEVFGVVRRLRDRFGVQSVAVCYLNSYRNGTHETRTRDVLRRHFPELAVSLSSEVNPVFREYERTCVTVFDAYVRPIVEAYLERLARGLHELGARGEVQIMQSRGGVSSVKMAVARPVSMLLSGPAAGVVGGRLAGQMSAEPNVITMDIGGTTCDVSLVRDGIVQITKEGRLRGYPLRLPTVDITSIGAGGGSIAWLDSAGGLHVGPRSAGAIPGPACYGLGGADPTVTDASVILGYLNPDYFAGGSVRLDVGLAREAVTGLASTVGLDLDAMALGIHRIMNAQMAEAVRLVTVKRGYDPRRFALVAFGGAGPVHAPLVARQLGIAKVIVPHSPGTLSAFGLLVADIEYDAVRAFLCRDEELDPKALEDVFGDLEAEGFRRLRDEALPSDDIGVRRSVDVRYVGQSFELEIPIAAPASARSTADCIAGFHRRHEEVFGHADPARPVEFVNVRTVHYIAVPSPEVQPPVAEAGSGARRAPTRQVCFERSARVDAAIHARAEVLRSGRVEGPCIIEQADTTTVVYPGMHAVADAAGNVIVWTAP